MLKGPISSTVAYSAILKIWFPQKIEIQNRRRQLGSLEEARLDQLVPQVGTFFTHLPLVEAFEVQNRRRAICSRKMVSPSFNDIRHILNSAQILALLKSKELKLVTFDGDVTLYEDGGSIERGGKIVTRIITLLKRGINVGVVTAAGYDDPDKYKERLYGLCFALFSDKSMSLEQESKLTVMGGESNYLFQYFETSEQFGFKSIDDDEWVPSSVKAWSDDDIDATLDVAQTCFGELSHLLALPSKCQIIRKKRAVGFVPGFIFDDELEVNVKIKIPREALEEMVLVVQKKLESYPPAQKIYNLVALMVAAMFGVILVVKTWVCLSYRIFTKQTLRSQRRKRYTLVTNSLPKVPQTISKLVVLAAHCGSHLLVRQSRY